MTNSSQPSETLLAPDIIHAVRAEVNHQLSNQRQIMHDAIGLATKIVTVAFALLLSIFTVFGLTTWRDIKNETVAFVKMQTADMLKAADSETGVKANLTTLLNRAVVAAALIRNSKNEANKAALSYADWSRLRLWIADEALELQDFKDALAVLDMQDADRKQADARALAKLLDTNPRRSTWIQEQPEKIEAILAAFKHRDIASRAIEIAKSADYSQEIRTIAAGYSSEVKYKEGVDRLLSTYDSLPWGPIKKSTLESVLSLAPEHAGSADALAAILKEPANADRLVAILSALKILWPVSSTINSDQDVSKIRALGPRLVEYLINNGAELRLRVARQFPDDRITRRRFDKPVAPIVPAVLFWIPNKTSKTGHFISLEQFSGIDPVWQLASNAADSADLERLATLLPGLEPDPFNMATFAEIGYFITAAKTAQIAIIDDSTEVRTYSFDEMCDAHITIYRNMGRLSITWFSRDGSKQSGTLKSIRGNDIKFHPQLVSREKCLTANS